MSVRRWSGRFVFNFILSWLKQLKSRRGSSGPTRRHFFGRHRSSAISRLIAVRWCSNKLHRSDAWLLRHNSDRRTVLEVVFAPSLLTCSRCNCYNAPSTWHWALTWVTLKPSIEGPSPQIMSRKKAWLWYCWVEWRKEWNTGEVGSGG